MKNLLLTFIALFLLGTVHAQESTPLVFSSEGKVKYQSTGMEKPAKLKDGISLLKADKVFLKEGGKIGILFEAEYVYVDQPGEYTVADLIGAGKLEESDAAEIFSGPLLEAIDPYFKTMKIQRDGFAAATTATSSTSGTEAAPPPKKKTRSGAGNKDNKIIRLQPTEGKVAGNQITFQWRMADPEDSNKYFDLIIMDKDGNVLSKQEVTGRKHIYNAEQLSIQPGTTFKWRAEVNGNAEKSTGDVEVNYVELSEEIKALELLTEDAAYLNASPATKVLMEAATYEYFGFLSKANEKYKAAKKEFKRNQLPRLMHKAFLWRYDLVR